MNKRVMLAAGLIAGAAAMTGCTADMMPAATPTPQTAVQATERPATASPSAAATATTDAAGGIEMGEETPAPIALLVDGKEVTIGAAKEQGDLLLPLLETAEALGYQTDSQQTEEEKQTRRVITLDKEESRITVSYAVSDNTVRSVTWQKDGLLIPVDARITTIGDAVYVPAAFFEEAMDVRVSEGADGVSVQRAAPKDTPETAADQGGENG